MTGNGRDRFTGEGVRRFRRPGQVAGGYEGADEPKEAKGKIKTWECDQDGDFRYLVQQYDGLAWIRPEVMADQLKLKLVWPKNAEPTQDLKGIFFGRFIEMILGHFSSADFTEIRVVALA